MRRCSAMGSDEDGRLGGKAPVSEESVEADERRERCATDRESLTPKETADCAGSELADRYENEEDGGS